MGFSTAEVEEVKLEVIEKKKDKFVFKLEGADHTICNLLKKELQQDKHVKIATYNIKHPLVGLPEFIIETDSNETPEASVLAAINRMKKTNDIFLKSFLKEVK